MRDFTAVVLGALAGSIFSFIAAFLYIAALRRIGPKLARTWRVFSWFLVHVVFALSQAAPMVFPIEALRRVGTGFPSDDALIALLFVCGTIGFIPPITYFARHWRKLRASEWGTSTV